MQILIIDNKSVHLERLQQLIVDKLGQVTFVLRDPREMVETDVQQAALVIISGGIGRSINKNPQTFKRMVDMIAAQPKPTIGICLGAEAIAVAYGAEIIEMPVRRVGNVRSYWTSEQNVELRTQDDSFMAYEFHKWRIADVPAPLQALAQSKDGVEVFKHTDLPIYGMQFHPEVRRLNNAGHEVFERILKTFEFKLHNQ